MDNEKSKFWGLVELMGHQRIVGEISEQTIGPECFLRVDVPNCEVYPDGFTKFYGGGAIYAITPITEQAAMSLLPVVNTAPISHWDINQAFSLIEERRKELSEVVEDE